MLLGAMNDLLRYNRNRKGFLSEHMSQLMPILRWLGYACLQIDASHVIATNESPGLLDQFISELVQFMGKLRSHRCGIILLTIHIRPRSDIGMGILYIYFCFQVLYRSCLMFDRL